LFQSLLSENGLGLNQFSWRIQRFANVLWFSLDRGRRILNGNAPFGVKPFETIRAN
jgi:hypothetical protein